MLLQMQCISKIHLETYDNPGWGIHITFKEQAAKHLKEVSDFGEIGITTRFQNDILSFEGNATQLVTIIRQIFECFQCEVSDDIIAVTQFLQDWYVNECDGDWEHTYGIKGELDDKGNVRLVIDLAETLLENTDWLTVGDVQTIQCSKENNQFILLGNVNAFVSGSQVFQQWAITAETKYQIERLSYPITSELLHQWLEQILAYPFKERDCLKSQITFVQIESYRIGEDVSIVCHVTGGEQLRDKASTTLKMVAYQTDGVLVQFALQIEDGWIKGLEIGAIEGRRLDVRYFAFDYVRYFDEADQQWKIGKE